MRILCAPDSFKGSLSAIEAVEAMARGIARADADVEVDRCPVADGGEGTVDAIAASWGAALREIEVTGPLGSPVRARWAMNEHTGVAVIEMAEAAGLHLVPDDQRDPTRTTTVGVGELIKAALDAGATQIVLGLGGSSTNDGGAGAAQALGMQFPGIAKPLTGADLSNIESIDRSGLDPRLDQVQLRVACDVTNPLLGPTGAAHVYAPQKGATPEQVETLDRGLAQLARCCDLDPNLPGSGAAGGFGYGAVALLGGKLEPGIELVLDACDFDSRAAAADLCLTGEGQYDQQSLLGKAVLGVAQRAHPQGTPTVALVGHCPEADPELPDTLAAVHVIAPGLPVAESISRAAELLEARTATIVSHWLSTQPEAKPC